MEMQTQHILDVLTYCMIALIFLAGLAGIYKRKVLPVAFRYLETQLLLAVVAELWGQLLMYHQRESTGIFNVYIMMEFMLLIGMAIRWMQNKRFTNVLLGAITIYAVAWCVCVMYNGYDTFMTGVFLFGCVVLSCCYLYIIFFIARITDYPAREPFFWIALGIMIYFGGCIPLFSMFDYLRLHVKPGLRGYLYTVNDVLAIIRYLLVLYGFSFLKKENAPE